MRNRTGLTERSPTGTDEVGYSNITKTESGKGCGFGRGECRPGDMFASSLENVTDKEDSAEQKISYFRPYHASRPVFQSVVRKNLVAEERVGFMFTGITRV